MGTTLDMMQAGSWKGVWVAAIEGYQYLITSDGIGAGAGAHGGDWDDEIGGLFVELHNDQRLDPRQPFTAGGRCTLRIVKTSSADTFGVDTHRATAGAETELRATLDRNDTTATVASTTNFASSGTIYIGTETIAYSGKTATTFTGLTRGMFSPFAVDGGTRFAQDHRVILDPTVPTIYPRVTAQPRAWPGRLVGVWFHRKTSVGIDAKAEAQLMFAGRIVAVNDDPGGWTSVELEPIQNVFKEDTVARVPWSAKVNPGVQLTEGEEFNWLDTDDFGVTVLGFADPLVVVASGASGANEINEGFYSHETLCEYLWVWLQAEVTAARLQGTYQVRSPLNLDGQVRTQIAWRVPNAGVSSVAWEFWMPDHVARFFGFTEAQHIRGRRDLAVVVIGQDDTDGLYTSSGPPLRFPISRDGPRFSVQIEEERGVFWDNYDLLAEDLLPAVRATDDGGDGDGIFLVHDKFLMYGRKDPGELRNLYLIYGTYGVGGTFDEFNAAMEAVGDNRVSVRQVYMIAASFANALKYVAYSTGTAGYNHADWDLLPYGVGLGIPHDLLASDFIDSCDRLPQATSPIVMMIEKTARVADLLGGDLSLRRAFTRWKDEHLQLATWKTPITIAAEADLDQSNKAAPTGQKENHRTASQLTGFGKTPLIKISYNRSLIESGRGDSGYASVVTIEDSSSIDDAGGRADTWTINARNTYSQFPVTGTGIEALLPMFLASSSQVTRDQRSATRSIDLRFFEGLSVGDIVTLTDEFTRDPDTGQRGVAVRPAFVLRHRYSTGGATSPNMAKPAPMGGEVELLLLSMDRTALYVPSANFDGGNYNAGTKVITCDAHAYSEASEAADASHFLATYKVRVIERDPADPTAPLSWDDTVASQTGNTITLTTGLTPGFDAAKKYRIYFDDYTDALTAQKTKCYQADDADALIADVAAPREYTYGHVAPGSYTTNAAGDAVELVPNASYGDGVARDVGHEAALNRLGNNITNYKTARSSPHLSIYEMAGTPSASGPPYKLFDIRPIFFSAEILTAVAGRTLTVAPFFKSTDGNSVSVRVTLARSVPTGSSIDSVDRGQIYAEAIFTTTSTTYVTATSQDLDIGNIPDGWGMAWLLLEGTGKSVTRGLAICQEGPLQ